MLRPRGTLFNFIEEIYKGLDCFVGEEGQIFGCPSIKPSSRVGSSQAYILEVIEIKISDLHAQLFLKDLASKLAVDVPE